MKMNKIAAAVVAASFAAGASAAVTDKPWTVAPADLLDVFVSGATAQDVGFGSAFGAKCTASGGQMVVFAQAQGTLAVPHASYTAYFCTEKMSYTGMSAPKYVLMHKRSEGGSGWGVGPVAGASAIDRMIITDAACTPDAAIATNAAITAVSTLVAADGEQKCVGTTAVVPDAGISDVEPALFNSPSNLIDASMLENSPFFGGTQTLPGSPGTVATNMGTLAPPIATNALTFGIPVTLNLRNALQDFQGMTFSTAADRDLEANAPSLTKAQVASLFTGTIKSWSQIKNAAGQSLNTFGVQSSDPAQRSYVCRRSPGSGTQTQFNALFLSDGCAKGADSPARDNDEFIDLGSSGVYEPGNYIGTSRLNAFRTATDLKDAVGAPAEGPVIHENQGSGDVDGCLNNLQDQGVWAVGVQSLEKGSDKYRFVKIDGVAPTTANVAANKYWNWAGSTLQYRSALGGAFTNDDKRFVEGLAKDTNTPAKLAAANTYNIRMYKVSGAGTGAANQVDVGYLATLENGYTPTIPFNEASPIMSSKRSGNTCRTATIPGNTQMLP
jgi:hypothetical protein